MISEFIEFVKDFFKLIIYGYMFMLLISLLGGLVYLLIFITIT